MRPSGPCRARRSRSCHRSRSGSRIARVSSRWRWASWHSGCTCSSAARAVARTSSSRWPAPSSGASSRSTRDRGSSSSPSVPSGTSRSRRCPLCSTCRSWRSWASGRGTKSSRWESCRRSSARSPSGSRSSCCASAASPSGRPSGSPPGSRPPLSCGSRAPAAPITWPRRARPCSCSGRCGSRSTGAGRTSPASCSASPSEVVSRSVPPSRSSSTCTGATRGSSSWVPSPSRRCSGCTTWRVSGRSRTSATRGSRRAARATGS